MKIYEIIYNDVWGERKAYFKDKETIKKVVFEEYPKVRKYKVEKINSILISSKNKNKFYLDEHNPSYVRFIAPDFEKDFFKFKEDFTKKFGKVLPENPDFVFKFEAYYEKDRFENNKIIYIFKNVNVRIFVIPSNFHKYVENNFEYFIEKIGIFEKDYNQNFFFELEIYDEIKVREIVCEE